MKLDRFNATVSPGVWANRRGETVLQVRLDDGAEARATCAITLEPGRRVLVEADRVTEAAARP